MYPGEFGGLAPLLPLTGRDDSGITAENYRVFFGDPIYAEIFLKSFGVAALTTLICLLMAYPLAAFVTGWLAERGWDRRYLSSALAMVAGLAVIYTGGALWHMATVTHSFGATLATSVLPFAPFDVAKIVIVAAILPQAWRLLGGRAE